MLEEVARFVFVRGCWPVFARPANPVLLRRGSGAPKLRAYGACGGGVGGFAGGGCMAAGVVFSARREASG